MLWVVWDSTYGSEVCCASSGESPQGVQWNGMSAHGTLSQSSPQAVAAAPPTVSATDEDNLLSRILTPARTLANQLDDPLAEELPPLPPLDLGCVLPDAETPPRGGVFMDFQHPSVKGQTSPLKSGLHEEGVSSTREASPTTTTSVKQKLSKDERVSGSRPPDDSVGVVDLSDDDDDVLETPPREGVFMESRSVDVQVQEQVSPPIEGVHTDGTRYREFRSLGVSLTATTAMKNASSQEEEENPSGVVDLPETPLREDVCAKSRGLNVHVMGQSSPPIAGVA